MTNKQLSNYLQTLIAIAEQAKDKNAILEALKKLKEDLDRKS